MPDLETLSRVAQSGAFVFVAVLLAATWLVIGVGMVKRWWAPGWAYDREVKRADDATGELVEVRKTFGALADEIRYGGRRDAPG